MEFPLSGARKAERERENVSKGGEEEISFHSNNALRSLGAHNNVEMPNFSLSGSLKQTAAEAAAAIKAKTHLPSVTSSRWRGDSKRETDREKCSAT